MISLFNTFKQEGTHTARTLYILYSGKRKTENGKRKAKAKAGSRARSAIKAASKRAKVKLV